MDLLEERMERYEKKLDQIMSKLQGLSGSLIAFQGNSSFHQKKTCVYLKNLTNQIYRIRKLLDTQLAYKEFKEAWDEEDDFGDGS